MFTSYTETKNNKIDKNIIFTVKVQLNNFLGINSVFEQYPYELTNQRRFEERFHMYGVFKKISRKGHLTHLMGFGSHQIS